jgi:uncharacterized protein (DUF983 family)
MFDKGTKIYSIVAMKCPCCHEGELFNSPLYKGKIYDMPDRCDRCGQSYNLEPGFYWGSMYVAYAYSSGALLIVAGLCLLVFHLSLMATLIILGVTMFGGLFYNARLSRSTWINVFVSYDANAVAKYAAKNAPEIAL